MNASSQPIPDIPVSRTTLKLGRFFLLVVVLACFLPAASCSFTEFEAANNPSVSIFEIFLRIPTSLISLFSPYFFIAVLHILYGHIFPLAIWHLRVSFIKPYRIARSSLIVGCMALVVFFTLAFFSYDNFRGVKIGGYVLLAGGVGLLFTSWQAQRE